MARRSSLRRKTLLIIGSTTLLLVGAVYFPARTAFLGSFIRLEEDAALRDLARVRNAVRDDTEQLYADCRDVGAWDDTWAFAGGDPAKANFVDRNYDDTTFKNNRLSLAMLVDPAAKVIFARGFDVARASPRPPPPASALFRGPGDPLLPLEVKDVKGILATPEGPMLVAAHPVLTSKFEGPARGTLILGRALDDHEVQRIAGLLRLSLTMTLVQVASATPELAAAARELSESKPTHTRAIDGDVLAAYELVPDVRGGPYLIFRVELAREIYQRGLVAWETVVGGVLLAALLFAVSISLLLERFVLRRMAHLNSDVEAVGGSPDSSLRVRVDGHDEIAVLATGINGMLAELQSARQVVREAFGRYVSEEIARTILSRPGGATLGGETREVTILFSDLRNYSTISEKLAPAEVVDMLNEYFGAMSEVIDREGGCVIEFLGDAILAVFGAPTDLPDHPARAVRAALAMRRRGAELNEAWEKSGKARLWKDRGIPALASRIGLHTGRVVAGNLGSKTRMKYAIIGDAVNTASRVENLNNALGTDLLFTDQVRMGLPAELAGLAEDKGQQAVKGRDSAVHVFTITGDEARSGQASG